MAVAGLARSGFQVVGVDKDQAKLDLLQQGGSPIYEPGLDKLIKSGVDAGKLHFTNDLKKVLMAPQLWLLRLGLLRYQMVVWI